MISASIHMPRQSLSSSFPVALLLFMCTEMLNVNASTVDNGDLVNTVIQVEKVTQLIKCRFAVGKAEFSRLETKPFK